MKIQTELKFLNDDADENEGLGDAGIETYKDAIYASIARETGQNSADARAGTDKPVKVNFDVITLPRNELPALEKFSTTIDVCLKQAIKGNEEKAIDFFERAASVLKDETIKVLRVADYNTKGLTGPCEKGTAFHSLVKGTGISKKDSDTSGGSFGIGKNAAFAVSELQTVFYSSQYIGDDNKLHFIAQGKAILVSHIDESENHKKGKGYWGARDYKAVTDITEVPDWLRREEQGTSIFSIGFRYQDGWQFKMAASLLANFFYAIHRGEMEFSVNNDEIQLNKKTLSSLFDREEIKNGAESNNNLDGFEFAKSLFKCITSAHTTEKEFEHNTLGKVSFKILVAEGMPKRLALVRNGMVITDSLEHFGDKFSRFSMSKEFVAIVEAKEPKGSAFIKKLENPRHDALSAGRLSDPTKRREAEITMKWLIKKIREVIKQETTTVPDNEVTVDELTEFFADYSNREKSNDPDHEDNLESFKYNVTEKQKRKEPVMPVRSQNGTRNSQQRQTNIEGNENGYTNGDGSRNNNEQKRNQNSGSHDEHGNEDTDPRNQVFELSINDIRNIPFEEGGRKYRRIFFTSPVTCNAELEIQATGINEEDELEIRSARHAEVINNKAVIQVQEGQRAFVDVEFADDYAGPIEVNAYTTGGSYENK